eukprot:TRINITY_DN13852_c0_g2_i1.p1 TRINITY_DN13852_c0_g2~~TRINITY_DN13852_c0_g2_i1.p1  ORF type:complete len:458 (-),score=59.97 TRINITY_DN13852_c0_g2_i1:223-1596(-)
MYQEKRSWLYLLTGASLLFTVVVIFRGFKHFDENFLPKNPAPLIQPPASQNIISSKYEGEVSQDVSLKTTTRTKDKALKAPTSSKPTLSTSRKSLQSPEGEERGPVQAPGGYAKTWLEDKVIKRQRYNISKVMDGFVFQKGGQLKNYTLESGGVPIRALVITTWRSGSTFLGDIMNAHPSTYYHYEPLLHFDIRQAREGHLANEGIRVVKNLMNCDYSRLNSYIEYGKSHNWLFSHNQRLWQYCDQGRNSFCWQPNFLNQFCSLFPFQSIKTVRLRLNLTQTLMTDPDNKVKVLLLVRDPRGTMESRKHRDWCPGNPDCEDPARLCQDLVSDYYAYKHLAKDYPGRYKVFRYEDFSMNPYNNSRSVFKFFGFTMHKAVSTFLDTHTKNNIGGVSSTFRDSKTAPFRWREKLTAQEVFDIQTECAVAMELWGYRPLEPEQDLLDLDPVVNLENFNIEL